MIDISVVYSHVILPKPPVSNKKLLASKNQIHLHYFVACKGIYHPLQIQDSYSKTARNYSFCSERHKLQVGEILGENWTLN